MDFNKEAIESIPSEYIKAYLTSINHKFTIDEQVSLIHNSSVYSLDSKFEILKEMLKSRKLSKDSKQDLRTMISNIESFYNSAALPLNVFAINACDEFLNIERCTCIHGLYNIEKAIDPMSDTIKQINLVSTYNGEILYRVFLNKDNVIYKIKIGKICCLETKLENRFVKIPTFIKIGDTVRRTGSDKEYIVVADPEVPNDLSNICTFENCVVAVVPKSKIKGKKYKKHINKIIKHRISNLTKENKKIDKLDKYTRYIPLTETELIEK